MIHTRFITTATFKSVENVCSPVMEYDKQAFEEAVAEYGEVFFVLDSDREYEVHGERSYDFVDIDGETFVEVEGLAEDEYLTVQFPLGAIEHHYSHKEV